ncbi:MAG: NAD(P)/FAD-dependent oxidoreductase [Spartobacteria bacterium]
MFNPIKRYTHWLHTCWPAGVVEKLPKSGELGATNIPGVRIVGDLTGIPLLKFSSKTGAEAVHAILAEPDFAKAEGRTKKDEVLDLAIIGGGVSGVSAAIEARKAGLNFTIFEATQPFSTVVNFPKAKPIYTYPTDLKLDGGIQFTKDVKEALLEEMEEQRKAAGIEFTAARIERLEARGGEILLHQGEKSGAVVRARRVIVAIGRSGNHRKLGCPGEDLDKVYNRLYDPKDFAGKNVLVVGGGDSALESAIALAGSGAKITVSYRKPEFARPKPENVEKLRMLEHNPKADVQIERPSSERVTTAFTSEMMKNAPAGSVTLALATAVTRIEPDKVTLKKEDGSEVVLPNDVVFSMIGREAPLEFFSAQRAPCARRLAADYLDQLHRVSPLLRGALSLEEQSSAGISRPALGQPGPRLSLQRPESNRSGRRQDLRMVEPRAEPALHFQTRARKPVLLLHARLLHVCAHLWYPARPETAHALREMADDRPDLLAVDSALYSAGVHSSLDGTQRLFRARSPIALGGGSAF